MKYLLLALALTGCLMDPHPKDTIVNVYCPARPDSTSWADTSEIDHMSCRMDPSGEPKPPGMK